MPRLLLIDQSVNKLGGHPIDCALNLGRVAAAAGYEIAIAAHQSFQPSGHFPDTWNVRSLFAHTTYKGDSVAWGRVSWPVNPLSSSASRREATPSLFTGWRNRWRDWRRRRYCLAFAEACRRFFAEFPPTADDLVYFQTMTEFDLVGLVEFLANYRDADRATWQIVFHFPYLRGREPDYASQPEQLAAMREHLAALFARLPPGVRLVFHATTPALAAQYNLAAPKRFCHSPYAVSPSFSSELGAAPDATRRPLRVVCSGGVRAEKGSHEMTGVVADLWDEFLAPGQLQVLIQAKHPRKLPPTPSLPRATSHDRPPLVHVAHPLPPDAYVAMTRDADCGLFRYNADTYYTRASGIFIEMLCAGVPVIVPAGTSMHDELAPQLLAHRRELAARLPRRDVALSASLSHGNTIASAVTLLESASVAAANEQDSPSAAAIAVSVRFAEHVPPGSYLRAELAMTNSTNESLRSVVDIGGVSHASREAVLWLPIARDAARVSLKLSNAFRSTPIAVDELSVAWIGADTNGAPPSSRVGLISAGDDQLPRLFRELLTHYAHYRQTASDFRSSYAQLHSQAGLLRNLQIALQSDQSKTRDDASFRRSG